jgi:putative YhdH/YhfP family quinone oxidoreductase
MQEEQQFKALVAFEDPQGVIQRETRTRRVADLPPGEVLIKVRHSSLNYKDALSATGNRGVTKSYPHTPGIDAAGVVVDSTSPHWRCGDEVVCTGYDLGMNTSGGFGEYIRTPGQWLVKKPEGLSLLETMQLGTAGFTAALCVRGLQVNSVVPGKGAVLVTGATGGVGTVAIMLLHKLGYAVTALTGKMDERDHLMQLGAQTVLDRRQFLAGADRPLLPAQWAGVIDTVGGDMLAAAVKGTGFDGVVTSCGNAASGDLPLTVYPFILRGVHLLGIYSANCPMDRRLATWDALGREWKLPDLARLCRRVRLEQLESEIFAMLAGKSKGRCVVDLGDAA